MAQAAMVIVSVECPQRKNACATALRRPTLLPPSPREAAKPSLKTKKVGGLSQ